MKSDCSDYGLKPTSPEEALERTLRNQAMYINSFSAENLGFNREEMRTFSQVIITNLFEHLKTLDRVSVSVMEAPDGAVNNGLNEDGDPILTLVSANTYRMGKFAISNPLGCALYYVNFIDKLLDYPDAREILFCPYILCSLAPTFVAEEAGMAKLRMRAGLVVDGEEIVYDPLAQPPVLNPVHYVVRTVEPLTYAPPEPK